MGKAKIMQGPPPSVTEIVISNDAVCVENLNYETAEEAVNELVTLTDQAAQIAAELKRRMKGMCQT